MPLFEFVCQDCGKEFEDLVFSKNQASHCPQCESQHLAKKISTINTVAAGRSSVPAGESCMNGGPCYCRN